MVRAPTVIIKIKQRRFVVVFCACIFFFINITIRINATVAVARLFKGCTEQLLRQFFEGKKKPWGTREGVPSK